jgi:hypothetical protein
MERFRSFVAHVLGYVILMLSVGMPGTSMASTSEWIASQSGSITARWASHASDSAKWINYAGTNVAVPRDNWRTLGSAVWDKSGGFDLNMIAGERWITLGRADAGSLGLSSREISDRMQRFPANASYVFAAYSPENGELSIEIQRIEKRPDGVIYIDQADFTPWHGEKWKAAGKYRTAAEVSFGTAGYNPFENFKGTTTEDPVFHNISWTGAQVAIGHAMRHYGAMIGFIAVSQSRTTQSQSTSGNFFKKTVTTTVRGWVKPEWYIATPVELQQENAQIASICVSATQTATEATSCDDPAHVAISGVSVSPWKGGNMPMDEEMVYQWTHKQSSWTIAFFAVILAIVTWGIASALVQVAPQLVAATGLTPAGLAGVAGVAYGVASTALHSGGGITQAQKGFFGSTGNGVFKVDLGSMSVQSKGLAQGVRNKHVMSGWGSNTVSSQKLFKGACGEDKTVAECTALGLDSGQMWRGDTYQEVNTTLDMRARYVACKADGLTGAALQQCAAPNATSWPAP